MRVFLQLHFTNWFIQQYEYYVEILINACEKSLAVHMSKRHYHTIQMKSNSVFGIKGVMH